MARSIELRVDAHHQIGRRQQARCVLRPFRQLEPGAGEDVAKARVFPFARIGEPEEVEMPDRQPGKLVRLDHGVSGALDAPLHTQCAQKVPHDGGLAGPQFAMQLDEGIADGGMRRQLRGESTSVVLTGPDHGPDRAFYNGRVAFYGSQIDGPQLVADIQAWARELGFSQIGVAGVDLSSAEAGLLAWLSNGFHGEMAYMQTHGLKRARPAELVPGTVSVITARMDYLPRTAEDGWQAIEFERLRKPQEAIVSLYAR